MSGWGVVFKTRQIWIASALIVAASGARADLQRLDESTMSNISGQSGVTLEVGLEMSADRLSYFDDGNGIYLEDFRVGAATTPGGPIIW